MKDKSFLKRESPIYFILALLVVIFALDGIDIMQKEIKKIDTIKDSSNFLIKGSISRQIDELDAFRKDGKSYSEEEIEKQIEELNKLKKLKNKE